MFKERIIAYEPWEKLTDTEKLNLFTEVDKVLGKRAILWRRYSRGIDFETPSLQYASTDDTMVVASDGETLINENKRLQILLEKFIVDLASGYLSGKTEYDVDATNEIQTKINKLVFNRDGITPDEAQELRYIVDTITKNNADVTELTHLFMNLLLYGSCYERIIDNKDGYQYYYLDALNTVAIWTDDVKPKLMAVVQAYKDEVNNHDRFLYRVYLPKKIEVYSRENKSKELNKEILKKEENRGTTHEWNEVPVVVYETQFSILDKVESIISAYEILLNNVKNTYKYNAEDCKMKIAGYRPQNPITIPNPNYNPDDPTKKDLPQMIVNPARILEDNAILSGKTFYVQEGGDADWLIKPVNAQDVTTMLKFYIDTIFQLAGIPNTTDLAFNSTDLNASAIDRKFYIMNIVTSDLKEGMEVLIRNRFRMFIERINIKAKTHYDVNNIRITINTNLPSMTDENIDQMLRLDGILSQETILEKLGYDYETERKRKESELDAQMAKFGNEDNEDDSEIEKRTETDNTRASKTDTDIIRANRKIQRENSVNIRDNIQRENAETVQSGTSVGSPIGHQNRGRN